MKIFKITFTIVCIIFIILFSFLFYTKKHSSKNIKEPNEPVVSVVISSYNMADSLPDAIDSIVNQTFENWELIVINDGSSDKTKKILSKYKNNPKITIINNKKNIGLANSLNKGISIAKGKYIARMDADDISLPTRLERQVAFMNTEKVDLLSSSFYIIGKKSIVYHKNVDHNAQSYS